jgi:ketosteroid isomerase-like protein
MTDFVAAEVGIRALHARYGDAVWRKDYPAFGDCFTEDAEWRIAGMVLRGRTQIQSTLERLMSNFNRVLMTFRSPILAVGNGVASGRTYVTEQSAFTSGRPGTTIGLYYERFVEQSDRWRFTWRLFQLHYMGPADLTGSFFEQADYGPPPAMPPLDAPTYNYSGLGGDKA